MVGLFTIVAIGFLLGMRHATDPDHVIAVTSVVTREHSVRRSVWTGIAWGFGHTFTILVVGGAIILFRITLPPRLALGMELAVAIMLVVLGLKNLGGLFASPAVAGQHTHHSSDDDPMDRWLQRFRAYKLVRPLLVGIVHGLAGSAALALLVLSTIPSLNWSLAYLAVFGLGTIVGMMLITLTISSTFAYGQRRFAHIGRHFGVAAGLISLVFGVFLAYQIGFVHGLFLGNATWIPR
jgi:sulfite exporter TauE/SafE